VLLTKGFEVEMYTGTAAGEVVGLIGSHLPGFARVCAGAGSAQRGVYHPSLSAATKTCSVLLLRPRLQLRQFLRRLGPYTLLPGSTLALGGSDHFERSDPGNPYPRLHRAHLWHAGGNC
jgi:predicted glutamate--cysteine ligase